MLNRSKPINSAVLIVFILISSASILRADVTGSIQESATTTVPYSAAQMLGGSIAGKYADAIWDYAPLADTAVIVSFGMDCSAEGPAAFFGTLCTDPGPLKTKVGGDNVTGVGTPNGKAFADAFHP